MDDTAAQKRLQEIPGVGPSMARDIFSLGYTAVPDLVGEDPEIMYQRLMDNAGQHIDRCVLYVFRCAVYYASNETHDPEKLKWWTWKE